VCPRLARLLRLGKGPSEAKPWEASLRPDGRGGRGVGGGGRGPWLIRAVDTGAAILSVHLHCSAI
jgi:hypothetical protein